jgi:flagellar biosynthesis/type III secretory pathway chaperone
MKVAEALQQRADVQKRLQQLRQRIAVSARTQEGEEPAEDPNALLAEADDLMEQLERLIRRINRTNVATALDAELSMTDALARRDVLHLRRAILVEAAGHASTRQDRYSRSEIRFVSPLDVAELHRRADEVAKRYRELDAKIQEANWQTELIDD